jgi:dTDP-4-amino-4,6-dideoxygalactose transaminase
VIGNRLIGSTEAMTAKRIGYAQRYDRAFAELAEFVRVPVRRPGVRHVYHLYMVRAKRRDELHAFLNGQGVEAKIHYPVPVHLQPAARHLGYGPGSFPVCEDDCRNIITLPAHPYLRDEEVEYVIDQVRSFYCGK